MKIEANIEFSEALALKLGQTTDKINVDADYVESNADDVLNWINNELETKYNQPIMRDDFNVTNIFDVLEDLKFDEFLDKTQYTQM